MIKKIYILTENGILLYTKAMVESEKFDDDLLVGFFASIANFSREALNTVIKNVDLGENNKLILSPIREEHILIAGIVSSADNNELVDDILINIAQDFIDAYSPEYRPNSINKSEVDQFCEQNLAGKKAAPKAKRDLLSWILLIPMAFWMSGLSMYLSTFLVGILGLDQPFFTDNEIYTIFLPGMFLLSSIVIFIVYAIPNLIGGYLMVDGRLGIINSMIYLVLPIIIFFTMLSPVIAIFIIAYTPVVIIVSLMFNYIGYRMALRKKLTDR